MAVGLKIVFKNFFLVCLLNQSKQRIFGNGNKTVKTLLLFSTFAFVKQVFLRW